MTASAASPAPDDPVTAFRRFNRLYTRFIGTLDEAFLHSDFSLSEARILYEVATRTAPKASELAESLGIDPGYLSRVLSKFECSGLLRKKVSAKDARYVELLLTTRGRSAFEKLNKLSQDQATSILSSLPLPTRSELIHCMQSVERLLSKPDAALTPFVLRPHRIGDMGWVVYSEAVGYAEQYGWDESFEALVARIAQEFIESFDPARERCWVAELDGQHVGHIFLVKHPTEPGAAKLRLLFVDRSARGRGLGETLVNECIRFARTTGYRKVVLWTQSILTSAHRIYQKAGFRLVKEEPHHSFGHDLIGQEWELNLP